MATDPRADPADARLSALMAAAQAGDRNAYAALLRDCVPMVRRVAGRRAPPDRIDDVVQETLLTVHKARHTYDPSRSFTAWLAAIADRRAVDVMRRAGREAAREVHAPVRYERHPDGGDGPGTGIERAQAAERAAAAVAALPERQREAVQYLVLQERSAQDAAAATGRSAGSLKVNLHRAIKALRVKLEGEN